MGGEFRMNTKNKADISKVKKQGKDISALKADVKKLNEFASAVQQQMLVAKEKDILKEFPTFSHLLRKMALEKDYPIWEYKGFVEYFIKDEKKREALKKVGVLISFERDGRNQWILGPAGIQLVNSWKANELHEKTNQLNETTNQLNKKIGTFTVWVIGLMILQIIVMAIIMFIRQLSQ